MIKAVLFDLDGTLHDRQASIQRLARSQHERFADLHVLDADRYVQRFVELDERGYVPKSKVYDSLCRELGLRPELSTDLEADFRTGYADFAVGFPWLHEVLQALVDRGIVMGMITNGGERMQSDKIHTLGLEPYFASILISESAGMSKPDPAIFELCLNQLGVRAEEAIFVGDHHQVDVAGSQGVGMKAVWFRDDFWGDCPFADAVANDLEGLLPVLEGLGLRS